MRKFILLFAMIASLSFAASPVAMAQDSVDLDAIGDTVLDADIDQLIAGMETPMSDDELPDGFSNAVFQDPDAATGDSGIIPTSDLDGSEGSVAYAVDWDPTSVASTPGAEASPEGISFAVRIGTLNYIFVGEEITGDDLDDFRDGVQQGAESTGDEATVETIQVNGKDAVLMTYVLEEDGIQSVVQMIALPVGNVMVTAMLVEAGETVDADNVRTNAEALVVSGAEYLGSVAEQAQ